MSATICPLDERFSFLGSLTFLLPLVQPISTDLGVECSSWHVQSEGVSRNFIRYNLETALPVVLKFGMRLDNYQPNHLEESEAECRRARARAYRIF